MSTFVLCVGCGEPLYGFSPCQWCTYEQCGIDMINGICPLCNSSNSCANDHNPNSFDYPPDSYHPPHPTYETYSGDTCGNNSHFGYNCPPRFPLNYKPEPGYIQNYNSYPHDSPSFPQQYPCCEDCGVTHEPYQSQPKNHDYYHEKNSCCDSNSIGFDQFQPQQYTVNNLIFNAHNEYLDSQIKLTMTLTTLPVCYDDDDDEESSNSLEDNIISELPSCDAITPNEPVDSLSMGDEHLNTISATESDEFIKSCVKNLFPNPSEFEGKNECDVPAGFTTFSNVLFNADYNFDSGDDQSTSDEDFPKKIYLNPLFDEEIIPMKIDPHPFNAESDLIESMPNHDSSITISSKINSLFDEFAESPFTKRLLYDNSSPRPPKEIVSDNSNADIESFSSSPIPNKDSDSNMEEIDLPFTPDDPMPLGIEDDDDSERDILILKELLDNYPLSLPKNESCHFDIPSPYRSPAKPPDGKTRMLNIKMIGDVSD
nr:pre-mRNA splicing Prp18-interacting factor [Tanacetum cinerariifolium]